MIIKGPEGVPSHLKQMPKKKKKPHTEHLGRFLLSETSHRAASRVPWGGGPRWLPSSPWSAPVHSAWGGEDLQSGTACYQARGTQGA